MYIVKKNFGLKIGNSVVTIEHGQYVNLPEKVITHRDFKLFVEGGYVEGHDSHEKFTFTEEQNTRYTKLVKTSNKNVLKPDFIKITPDSMKAKSKAVKPKTTVK